MLRSNRIAWVFWLSILACLPAAALDPHKAVTQYLHTTWTSAHGLPQNAVQAICQSRDGYLWLGTQEGLARFDGLEFTVYDRRNTPLMTNSTVQAILEDREGSIWVGTEGGGVLRLRGDDWTGFTAMAGLPNDIVYALLQDREGAIWAGTYSGAGRFKDGRWARFGTAEGLTDGRINALFEDRAGTLWVATDGGGLFTFGEGRFRAHPANPGLPDLHLRAVTGGPDGSLWVGMEGRGLAVLRGDRWQFYTMADGLPGDRVYSLCWDRDGSLWAGTEGGGLGRFAGGRWETFSTRQGLSSDLVYALKEDREGALWIGAFGGGLDRLRDSKWTPYTTAEGLLHDTVWCAYAGRDGSLWLGTERGLSHLSGGRWTNYTTRDGLPHNRVRSIFEDRSGAVWVGTGGGGLGRLKEGHWTTYTTRNGLTSDRVYALLEDRNGVLWVGTYGGGLDRLEHGRWSHVGTAEGLANDRVRSILEDRDGVLWVGTFGGGLSRCAGGKWTTVTSRDGLGGDLVLTMHQDRDGALWVATSGSGLCRLKNGRWSRFTMDSGLCDDKAFQILEDDRGHFWMSSNKGIFEVDRAQLDAYAEGRLPAVSCTLYGLTDGLLSTECNGGSQPAGCRTADGRIWFPTLRGAATLDPGRVVANNVAPLVSIERVLVNRLPVSLHGEAERSRQRGELEVHYTGLSLLAPHRVQFKYMLEPYDREWVEAGTRRQAFYTNLPAGRYRFRLTSCNEDGVWSARPAAFSFTLTPPFHRTLPFYLLLLLAGSLGAWSLYGLSVRRIKARAAALERLVDERTHQLAEANQHLESLSVRDSLTGAYNRRRLDEFLGQEWNRAVRLQKPFSVLIVDIDRFKSYNDTYGHQAGDACIRAVASMLATHLRRPSDLVARYGGDEFVVVMADMESKAAENLAETLRAGAESLQCGPDGSALVQPVTVSIGMACQVPDAGHTYEGLLKAADDALFMAKEAGRNRVASRSPKGCP